MKTSHQLARELLTGPDLPIYIYTKPDEDNRPEGHEPKPAHIEGFDAEDGGDPVECIELYGLEPHAAV